MSSPYALEKLMEQTRKLAVEYKLKTGQTLPISSELANFDVQKLFQFQAPNPPEQSIDFLGAPLATPQKIQLKSRVMFDHSKNYRIGQFNLSANWDYILLALYDDQYQLTEIYGLEREVLCDEIDVENKRGAISIKKFKAIGQLLWTPETGFEFDRPQSGTNP